MQLTKTQIMDLVIAGKIRECFEHCTSGKFDITAMQAACRAKNAEVFEVEITKHMLLDLRTNRDYDRDRIQILTKKQLKDPCMTLYDDTDDTHLIIDGIHRILRLHQDKKKYFKSWLVSNSDIIRPEGLYIPDAWGEKEFLKKHLG